MLDEESTDVDDMEGAFTTLLSGPASEDEPEVVDGMTLQSSSEDLAVDEETNDAAEREKSTMVCRHWKSKGWCRLESNCRFLHPENKRGVSAPKCGGNSSVISAGMNG